MIRPMLRKFLVLPTLTCLMAASQAQDTSGSVSLRIGVRGQTLEVDDVPPDSPVAGRIFPGDQIVEVNGQPAPSQPQDLLPLVKGPVGTNVHLTVMRYCSPLMPRVAIPVSLKLGHHTQLPLLEVSSDEDYLWNIARITRQHVIDTSYVYPGNDKYSVRRHMERLMALERTVAAGNSAAVSQPLRGEVRQAIKFDFMACGMNQVWDDMRDANLKEVRQMGRDIGMELLDGGSGGDAFSSFAANVIGRSVAQVQSYRAYQQLRQQANPHAEWQSLFNNRLSSLSFSTAPFAFNDLSSITDPNWQFIRRLDLPFDQYQGLGNRIINFPRIISGQDIVLNRGYCKFRIGKVTGFGRWQMRISVPSPQKYLFVLLQTDHGVLGVAQTQGGECTWASRYDAFYANSGMIGRETRSYGGNIDLCVVHRTLPLLGEEGGASSGTIYIWTSDTPEFPEALWDAPTTDVIR